MLRAICIECIQLGICVGWDDERGKACADCVGIDERGMLNWGDPVAVRPSPSPFLPAPSPFCKLCLVSQLTMPVTTCHEMPVHARPFH